jgi:hypothetical protein
MMFALSFGKILVLGVILFAAWTFWRRSDRRPPPHAGDPAAGNAVDLIQCPVCSVFVSRHNRRRCDRGDCPAN